MQNKLIRKGLAVGIIVLILTINLILSPSTLTFAKSNKISIEKKLIYNKESVNTWRKTFGGNSTDTGQCVQQTLDGGFIIAGRTYSYDISGGDGWLIKINEDGNVVWDKTFGNNTEESFSSVYQTTDYGFILTGYKSDKCWLIKTDSDGNQIWNKTYSGVGYAAGFYVIQTNDNGYLVVGDTTESEFDYNYNYSIFILKVDDEGTEQWNITYGKVDWNAAYSCKQTLDGGFIVTGEIYNESSSYWDAFLLKIDTNGNEEWFTTFNSNKADIMIGYDVIQNSDGSFVMIGYMDKNTFWWFKGYMLKTDSNGNELWRKEYSNFLAYNTAYRFSKTNDGGYIMTGETYSKIHYNWDLWLAKTDKNGNLKWSRTYGIKGENPQLTVEYGICVKQTSDKGYIVLGNSNSNGIDRNDYDILLIKTDDKGKIAKNCHNIISNHFNYLSFYNY